MSRFVKLPIKIPDGVKVNIAQNNIKVEGPKGKLEYNFSPNVEVSLEDKTLRISAKGGTASGGKAKEKMYEPVSGTTKALINNMIIGVTQGYEKTLVIEGQGYRATLDNNKLSLLLGFSKPVIFDPPAGIKFEVPAPQRMVIRGIDKELVGKITAAIRDARPPEPYKGKGIAYVGEYIRRKAGKKAVGGGYGAGATS